MVDRGTRPVGDASSSDSKGLLARVLAGSSDPIAIFAAEDRHLLYANDAWCALAGRAREELRSEPASADLAAIVDRATREGSLDGAEIALDVSTGPEHMLRCAAHMLVLDGQPAVLVMGDAATVRREEVERRDAILEAAAFVASSFLRAESWEVVMETALGRLAEAAGVQRAYLYENQEEPDGTLSMIHRFEWNAPDVDGTGELGLAYPYGQRFVRWEEVLGSGGTILGPVRELPEPERAPLEADGVRSTIAVPVVVAGRWWGFLGFDDLLTERVGTRGEVGALRVAAEALGAAIEHRSLQIRFEQAELTHRHLIERLPGVVYIESLEEGSPDVYLSPQYQDLYGEEPGTRLNRPNAWRDLIHPDDLDEVLVESARSSATNEPFLTEYRVCRSDGTIRWVRDECVLITGADGEPLYWLGLVTDLTAEREAQERSRAAEERFRILVEHIPVAAYVETMDRSPDQFYISPQIETITGWAPERFQDATFWERNLHPDDREAVLAEERRADASGEPFTMDYRYLRPDGSVVWLHEESRRVTGPKGEALSQGVIADITEQKEAEERLREAEERYRTLVERLPVVIYQETVPPGPYPGGALSYVSPQFEALTGLPGGEMDSKTYWETLLLPEDYEASLQASARSVETGEPTALEYRVRTADGSVLWVQDRSVPTDVQADGTQVWHGVLIDITERRSAEEQSARAQDILRAVASAAERFLQSEDWREGIEDTLRELGEATNMSRAYLFEIQVEDGRRHGYETYEWVAPGIHSTKDRPDNQGFDLDEEETAWQARMRTGAPEYGTIDDYPDNREYLLAEGIVSVLTVPLVVGGVWWGHLGFDDCVNVRTWTDGEIETLRTAGGILSAAIERQLASERLGESEATQRELIERLPGIVYMTDVTDETNVFYMSPQYESLFGYTAEERLAQPDLWQRLVHPDDRERVVTSSRESHVSRAPFTEEYRMFHRDGTLRWIRDEAVLVLGDDGEPRFWLGLILDVTEQRRAEAALRLRDAILGAVGFAAARFLDSLSWEEPLPEILQRLGEAGAVSRCYLFRNEMGEDDRIRANLVDEWCAPDVTPSSADPRMRGLLVGSPTGAGVPAWARDLASGGVVRINSVATLEDEGERELLMSQDIASILEVPIFVGNEWWGWLGFDECGAERVWSQAAVDALQAAAGLLGSVVSRLDSEALLRRSEERQRLLVERMPAIVYVDAMDEANTSLYISPAVERILGYTAEEGMRSPTIWRDSLHPEDRERVLAESARVDQTLEPFAMEYRMIAQDGTVKWLHDESQVFYDDEGRPLHWQGVMVDITGRKQVEEELERTLQLEREAVERLRTLDEMKNTFLTAVSHDLRTPLAAVLGLALTLERDDIELDGRETHDLAHRIAMNARKLDRLVTDLLDLDRLSRGILGPNLSKTDLGLLARKAVEESDFLGDHSVIVEAESVELHVDTAKVERIIENLLANTVRHTPLGTNVWVRVQPEGTGALLMVEDDGPGIPAELREAVFEPFRQGSESLGHSPGVGIGLSLVARFAELHGGRAWVAERAGGGASFRVFLPDALQG